MNWKKKSRSRFFELPAYVFDFMYWFALTLNQLLLETDNNLKRFSQYVWAVT